MGPPCMTILRQTHREVLENGGGENKGTHSLTYIRKVKFEGFIQCFSNNSAAQVQKLFKVLQFLMTSCETIKSKLRNLDLRIQ